MSKILKRSKWQFFELQNDKNWFHVNSEWQKNPENSTLCFPYWAAQVCIRAKRYIFARKEVGFCEVDLKRVRGNWIYSFYLFIQVANCRLIQWILKFFILSLLLRFISCLNVLLFNFFLFKGHWIIFWREPNICMSK